MNFKYPPALTQDKESLEVAYLNSGAHVNKSFVVSRVLISGLPLKTSLSAWFMYADTFLNV